MAPNNPLNEHPFHFRRGSCLALPGQPMHPQHRFPPERGFQTMRRLLNLAGVLMVLALTAIRAEVSHGAFIYTYTGSNFESITDQTLPAGAYTTSMRVTGTLTLALALAPNTAFGPDGFANPLSFSFTDGRTTLTEANTGFLREFIFGTDSLGRITTWQVTLEEGSQHSTLRAPGSRTYHISTYNQGAGFQDDNARIQECVVNSNPDGLCEFFGTILADTAQVLARPGVWNGPLAAAPTPATWMLLIAGMAALLASRSNARLSSRWSSKPS